MSGGYYGFTSGGTQYGSVTPYSYAAAPGTNAATAYNPPVAYNTAAAYGYTAGSANAGAQAASMQAATNANRQAAASYNTYGANAQYAAQPTAGAIASATSGQQKSQTQSESATYTGYDAALYAAAKSYLASKTTGNTNQWMSMKKSGTGGGTTGTGTASSAAIPTTGGSYNKFGGVSGGRGSFPRRGGGQFGGPRNYGQSTQVHYCEVCKISCGALQTYREHLEGKMHKKKEALIKSGPTNPARSKNSFYCEVCEIMCTGSDTFQSHVKGSKHQKTLRLHQQMGKPVPNQEAKVIPPLRGPSAANGEDAKKMVVVQKTNFIAGEKLLSTGVLQSKASQPTAAAAATTNALAEEEDVQPVGEDYLEVIKIENNRVTAYHCKLCDCRFTDLGAKDMHMKGRRHRLNYKKKVNPELEVEIKLTPKTRRQMEDRARRDMMRMRQQDIYSLRALYQSHMSVPTAFGNLFSGGGARPGKMAVRDSEGDRYIMAKHNAIYPTSEECAAAQRLVVSVEKALKNVSDLFADEDIKVKKEEKKLTDSQEERLLKGVMRVGDLAKQLLLKGDFRLELVVLCNERPTEKLLRRIAELLPQKFDEDKGDKFDVISALADAGLVVKMTTEPYFELKITFTSVAVREEAIEMSKDAEPLGVLDKQKCLEALASLRHAKWFQARCASLQFCLILLRVLKDFCQRTPAWIPLTSWATELLVEKVLNSGSVPAQPIEAFRRFFEAVASGILMKNGPGLMDPCEKTPVDAARNLSAQQREDITASAQYILRMIAFGKVHTVLGVEKTEVNGIGQRKRPREDVEMGEVTNGKKDKKET